MDNFKRLVEESDGPMDLSNMKSSPLFNLDEEVKLGGIVEKLVHAANVIVDHRIAIAIGLERNANAIYYNSEAAEWILSQVAPMLKTVQQTKKINAESMAGVTEQLKKGKITIPEAKAMMELINQKSTMDRLEELT